MKKLRQIALSLNSLRKFLGFSLFFRSTKFNHHLEITDNLDSLDFRRVLVLSPHPDDDVFGLGGVIAKFTATGAQVTVAYFCDGSGGSREVGWERDLGLVEARMNEAKRAGEILKISKQVFFGYPDGKLTTGGAAQKALNDLIKQVKPDIIFVPSFLDNHPDHRATNDILFKVLSQKDWACDCQIWLFEIWTPIFVNRLVNITNTAQRKQEAMEAQESQLQARAYDKAIFGLNQYRAEINGLEGFAEGFFATTIEVYKKLYKER